MTATMAQKQPASASEPLRLHGLRFLAVPICGLPEWNSRLEAAGAVVVTAEAQPVPPRSMRRRSLFKLGNRRG